MMDSLVFVAVLAAGIGFWLGFFIGGALSCRCEPDVDERPLSLQRRKGFTPRIDDEGR